MKEYYKILKVPFWASDEEVKKAYRSLVQEYHPDRNDTNPVAEEKIKEINEAYKVLGNAEKRREYDFNCIITNHYTPHQPAAAGSPVEERESFHFPPTNETPFNQEHKRDLTSRLHQHWKKVLWVAIPVILTIAIVYFLLPGQQTTQKLQNAVVENEKVPAVLKKEAAVKTFPPASNAVIATRWQNNKLIYKLDIWMPAGNSTPAEQSRQSLGTNLRVDFYDRDGFKLAELPLQSSLNTSMWNRTDTLYTCTISDQVDMPLDTYNGLVSWKIHSDIVEPAASAKKAIPITPEISSKVTAALPVAPKKSAGKKAEKKKKADDILTDETIRSGFKKNEQ